jgi:hypothetical protein
MTPYQSTIFFFYNYVHFIYPGELEIKNTTAFKKSAAYLDILMNIDSNVRLTTNLYDKRDDFDFTILIVPFLCSNTLLSPADGVFCFKLIGCTRAWFLCDGFSKRGELLARS